MPEPAIPTPDAERTTLSGERTLLAWWRTGLAALAVGVGVGRIGPELRSGGDAWPYVALGVVFTVYAVALFVYGSTRGRRVEAAAMRGELSGSNSTFIAVMTAAGILLGFGTALLVIFG